MTLEKKTGKSDNQLKCSFCGKKQEDVIKLIAGPGVYICNECVGLCNEILNEELFTGTNTKTGSDPLAAAAQELLTRMLNESTNHLIRCVEDSKTGLRLFLHDTCLGSSTEDHILYASALDSLINRQDVAKCGKRDGETMFQLTWQGLCKARRLAEPPAPASDPPPAT